MRQIHKLAALNGLHRWLTQSVQKFGRESGGGRGGKDGLEGRFVQNALFMCMTSLNNKHSYI